MGDIMGGLAVTVISILIICALVWLGDIAGTSDERNKWCKVKYATVIDYEGCRAEGVLYQPKK